MRNSVSFGSWLSRNGLTIVLIAAIAAVGLFIIGTRKLQLARLLPFAGVLLCPLMHVFIHRGHGAPNGHGHEPDSSEGEMSRHHRESRGS